MRVFVVALLVGVLAGSLTAAVCVRRANLTAAPAASPGQPSSSTSPRFPDTSPLAPIPAGAEVAVDVRGDWSWA